MWNKDTMRFNSYSEIKVKCKHCGHTNTIPVFVDEKICSFCKNKIKNESKAYFKYKMNKILKEE